MYYEEARAGDGPPAGLQDRWKAALKSKIFPRPHFEKRSGELIEISLTRPTKLKDGWLPKIGGGWRHVIEKKSTNERPTASARAAHLYPAEQEDPMPPAYCDWLLERHSSHVADANVFVCAYRLREC